MISDEERLITLWKKHFLQLEIEKLETIINHYRKENWINDEDYQFLNANLKVLKFFLIRHVYRPNPAYKFTNTKQPHHQKHKRNSKHRNPIQPSLFDIPKPFPITGTIAVAGLNEHLKALKSVREVMPSVPKFPYKIPAGTHWHQIIIKFLDDEQIEVWVKKQKHITNYIDMGMTGKGNIPEPSEQWLFLKVLAQCHGEITIKDREARGRYKKQKQALSETLKSYFSIDYDPFYPYQHNPEKSGNSYKIKVTLIPPPQVNNKENNIMSDDKLGIQDFLNEQAPQI